MFKSLKQKLVAVVALATFAVGSAFAAVPPEVTTALDTAKADSSSIAYTVLGIVVAIFGIKLMRKAL